jgi:DNA-binding NarL/FixJ family response regulator
VKKKVTVLLVDDHTLVRRGFRRLIEDERDLTVVGEAGDGCTGVQMARKLKPAVAVMDISLPVMDGLLAAAEIVQSCQGTAVLMCSMHSEDSWVNRAVKAGARGYVLKSADALDLVSAIRRVAAGELLFAANRVKHIEQKSRQEHVLSAREREILQLIVDGKSNREIASHLNLSASTVAAHRTNIMKGLRIRKAIKLVRYAIQNGLALID